MRGDGSWDLYVNNLHRPQKYIIMHMREGQGLNNMHFLPSTHQKKYTIIHTRTEHGSI